MFGTMLTMGMINQPSVYRWPPIVKMFGTMLTMGMINQPSIYRWPPIVQVMADSIRHLCMLSESQQDLPTKNTYFLVIGLSDYK
jgi:hypothetical protein